MRVEGQNRGPEVILGDVTPGDARAADMIKVIPGGHMSEAAGG
jgi:hypothetical protein